MLLLTLNIWTLYSFDVSIMRDCDWFNVDRFEERGSSTRRLTLMNACGWGCEFSHFSQKSKFGQSMQWNRNPTMGILHPLQRNPLWTIVVVGEGLRLFCWVVSLWKNNGREAPNPFAGIFISEEGLKALSTNKYMID